MARVDLTVRGGGITGLAVAWEAARRGARVRLIEAQRLGAGASGGLVGALAPHAPEGWDDGKALQLRSLLAQADFWAGVAEAGGGDPVYARTGRVQPLGDAAAVERARVRGLASVGLWQGQAVWQVIERPDHALAPPSASGLVVFDDLTARLSPRGAVAALGAALRAKGAEVVLGEGAEEGAVIHATGFEGLAALSQSLGRPVGQGVKGQAASFAVPGVVGLPQVYAGGLHVVPHADGTVAIGSTTESSFANGSSTDAALDTLIARARALLPVLAEAPVVARWAGVRPKAMDRQVVMGAWPGRKGHFLANGGFKTGFGLAPEIARLMVDLVLEGRDAIPPAMRADRLATDQGRTQTET